jgi:hypothetical protein
MDRLREAVELRKRICELELALKVAREFAEVERRAADAARESWALSAATSTASARRVQPLTAREGARCEHGVSGKTRRRIRQRLAARLGLEKLDHVESLGADEWFDSFFERLFRGGIINCQDGKQSSFTIINGAVVQKRQLASQMVETTAEIVDGITDRQAPRVWDRFKDLGFPLRLSFQPNRMSIFTRPQFGAHHSLKLGPVMISPVNFRANSRETSNHS